MGFWRKAKGEERKRKEKKGKNNNARRTRWWGGGWAVDVVGIAGRVGLAKGEHVAVGYGG